MNAEPKRRNEMSFEETMAFLRSAPPPGEYSRVETEKRRAARATQQAVGPEVKLTKVRASQFWDGPTKTKNKRKYRGAPAEFFGNFVGKPCAYCEQPMIGRRFPTRDHVTPLCLGGSNRANNLKVVCAPCNGHKGARTLEQFAMFLTDHGDPRATIVWGLLERAPPVSVSGPIAPPPQTKRRRKTIPFEAISKYVLRGGFWVEK